MDDRLGIIADDNTGASDAAGMLSARGVRTVLLLSLAALAKPHPSIAAAEAVVVGTQNRAVAPPLAAAATRSAIQALRGMGIARFQIKFCSTFDSTPTGNIGPTLDAALDELTTPATIVCPSLPVNGRTVYLGHLFVGRQLLSESPLRHHPLNPMTDANILRWLGHQTNRAVALVELPMVHQGATALQAALHRHIAAGAAYIVIDAVEDADLATIARATADWPLISGGSGITAAVAALGTARPPLRLTHRLAALPPGTLVVSASQSPMTQKQCAVALAGGFIVMALDVPAIVRGQSALAPLANRARDILAAGGQVLIHAPAGGGQTVRDIQALGAALGLNTVQTGQRITAALAALARQLVDTGIVGKLVVSGGETSGVVCHELGIESLEVGLSLSPGVPWCFPLDGRNLLVVLKSGNFGDDDLYLRVRAL